MTHSVITDPCLVSGLTSPASVSANSSRPPSASSDPLLEGLSKYLSSRVAARQIRPLADVDATAAVLTQTIAWANLQRPYDPGFTQFTEQSIEDATIDLLVSGLLPYPRHA